MRSQEWSAVAPPGAAPGRVVRCERTVFNVALERGEETLPLAPAMHRDPALRPTTGDWVVVAGGEITGLLERRTAIQRAAAMENDSAQVLCANVDSVLVVVPLSDSFRPRKIERLLVLAWQSGAIPIVVLTKADCADDVAVALERTASVAPGVAVHAVSAITGEAMGELAAELAPGTTTVAIGASGVGKSTLANWLSGGTAELATLPVRSDGKGRHTTVHRELVRLANGALMIDTPGLRSIGLFEAGEAIGDAFSDVEELASTCRFSDCGHRTEPGCAIRQAISDGRLDTERFESYERLVRDQQRLAARLDARLRAERARELRAFSRRMKEQFKR
jgi:ribosome biogenesis GTPase